MTHTKQTVYLPVKVEGEKDDNYDYLLATENGESFGIKKIEAFVFTPEQLNQLLSDVIKDTLNTAAESAMTDYDSAHNVVVDKESITNTFEETFKKFKV